MHDPCGPRRPAERGLVPDRHSLFVRPGGVVERAVKRGVVEAEPLLKTQIDGLLLVKEETAPFFAPQKRSANLSETSGRAHGGLGTPCDLERTPGCKAGPGSRVNSRPWAVIT